MNPSSLSSLVPPRMVSRQALLLLGIRPPCRFAGDPAILRQWNDFVPYIGNVDGQVGSAAYRVIDHRGIEQSRMRQLAVGSKLRGSCLERLTARSSKT